MRCFEIGQACFGIGPDDLCRSSRSSINATYGKRMGSFIICMNEVIIGNLVMVSDSCDLALSKDLGSPCNHQCKLWIFDYHVLVNANMSLDHLVFSHSHH